MASSASPINLRRYRLVRNAVVTVLTLVVLGGFLLAIPQLSILEETARNLYFHVPMWFTLMAATLVSAYHSLRYLQTGNLDRDVRAREAARLAVVFGVLGIVTGMMWARFTWYEGTGKWWNFDPKQSMAAVLLLIYGAYFVLRDGIEVPIKRARIAAVYNLFAFVTMPFQMASLHPGAEGNPAFSDITAPIMRLVLYPAFAGFIGLFWVLYTQRVRMALLRRRARHEPEL